MADLQTLLGNLGQIIGAIAGLGTAAAGLVDASKAAGGGISHVGFARIERALHGLIFDPPRDPAKGADAQPRFGRAAILGTLRANWINGVAMPAQKAAAKSLIHLGLTEVNAPHLAAATSVDPKVLGDAARKIASGTPLISTEVAVLGQFDAVVSAMLDEGFERADQEYRNAAKLASGVVSVVIAILGGYTLHPAGTAYIPSTDFGLAVLVGLVATPLAPVAKNLSSTLAAAVSAVGAVKLKR
jgi:hypothetical protein